MTITHPDSVSLTVIMAVFTVLYALVFTVMMTIGVALGRLKVLRWSHSRIRRVIAGAALLPVFLLVLQSIGQLTVRDVLLAGSLALILYFYFARMATPTPRT